MMLTCWLEDTKKRPSFKDLMTTVDNLIARNTSYLDMQGIAIDGSPEYVYMQTKVNAHLDLHTDDETAAEQLHKDPTSINEQELPGNLNLYDQPKSNFYLNEGQITDGQFGSDEIGQPDSSTNLTAITADGNVDEDDSKQLIENAEGPACDNDHHEVPVDLDLYDKPKSDNYSNQQQDDLENI